MDQVEDLARETGLLVHLDGARIFMPQLHWECQHLVWQRQLNSVTFCLSKALCAPVGSVLCGSKPFIAKARRIRKQLGGGMRQAGILAAAGIVALENMVDRLAEDHLRAQRLAHGLSAIPGLVVERVDPPTNMVFASLEDRVSQDAAQVAQRLLDSRVRVGTVRQRRFRMVTHYWVDDEGIDRTLQAFSRVL